MGAALKGTLEQPSGEEGRAYHVFVPLERVDVDEANLRDLETGVEHLRRDLEQVCPKELDFAEFLAGLDPQGALIDGAGRTEAMLQEVAELLELASTIASVGTIQPVRAYAHGERYVLIAGERRYLASILAARRTIPAMVYHDAPPEEEIRLLQYIENKQRTNLPVRDEILAQCRVVEALARADGAGKPSVKRITAKLGCSRSFAHRAIRFSRMQEDVRDAVLTRRLRSLNVVDRVISEADAARRERMINAAARADSERAGLSAIERIAAESRGGGGEAALSRATAGATRLGRTRPDTAARLLRALLATDEFAPFREQIIGLDNLSSSKAVERAWKHFIKALEGDASN